jgi:hypothetical protein
MSAIERRLCKDSALPTPKIALSMSEPRRRRRIRPHVSSVTTDQSTKPSLTFINLSHPDEMKDRKVIDHIRCSAMTNFSRTKRKRRKSSVDGQIVFEVETAGCPVSSITSSSSVGLKTVDASVSRQSYMVTKASGCGSDSK